MLDLIPTVSAIAIIGGFFAIIFLVLWIALPFSVFGIKPLLRQVIERLDRLNKRLDALEQTLANSQDKNAEVDIETGPRRLVSGGK